MSSTSEGIGHCRIFCASASKFREYIGGRDSPYYHVFDI
nr:MAG TPA: hypothetical protein [Microviridae sp.]